MNLIDVTLRDGGHIVDFDWPDDFLEKYLAAVSKVDELNFIELGYWSQTAKSKNRFYNMNSANLEDICGKGLLKPASIMIDYHYCQKEMSAYRSEAFDKNVGLIRLCSRREDIEGAVKFGRELIDKLGVDLSLNFFNITNYSQEEVKYCIEHGKAAGAKYLYFADTHGALDLHKEAEVYGDYAKMVRDADMIPGLHLHDHSGKAYLNYCIGKDLEFGSFDCSLSGMGKGVGNLKMEHVVNPLENLSLLDLLSSEGLLRMPTLIPGLVTSALSATDYYAVWSEKLDIKPSELAAILRTKSSSERDIFNKELLIGSSE
jgi:4-hydroxy 2-oxovalerate aldolase